MARKTKAQKLLEEEAAKNESQQLFLKELPTHQLTLIKMIQDLNALLDDLNERSNKIRFHLSQEDSRFTLVVEDPPSNTFGYSGPQDMLINENTSRSDYFEIFFDLECAIRDATTRIEERDYKTALKLRALEKLTPEEKQVLGITT